MNEKKQNSAVSALLAVFPTLEIYSKFAQKSENAIIIQSFSNYAFQQGLIKTRDKSLLEDFIQNNEIDPEDRESLGTLTLEGLFEKKKNMLQLNLSERALINRINTLIGQHQIKLPKVSNSMLTRLKKEPPDTAHKLNALRSIAYWMGYERAWLGKKWNFETLLKLCREIKKPVIYNEGIRIGFAIYSRGDVIGPEVVAWLKKELKNFIKESPGIFPSGHLGKVRAFDITTLYIDIPKVVIADNPVSYRRCVRNAILIAHQIAVRWALSGYCTKKRFLSIGIAAGDFAYLSNYLLPVLNARMPGDPIIRMTEYTHQCMLVNDIRAIFCDPKETALFNGETLRIWFMSGPWSSIYRDFIPGLLKDEILQNNSSSVKALSDLLWPIGTAGNDKINAVTTFFKSPQNSMLGVEITKTLYYRRRFREAIEILRIVLSTNPTDLNARTLRMKIFRELALEAPSLAAARHQFERAEEEAAFTLENCSIQSEDFYCENGVIHLAKAIMKVKHMRSRQNCSESFPGLPDTPKLQISPELQDIQRSKGMVFLLFDKAEKLFIRGGAISPSGLRSAYLLICVRVLREILKRDEDIFINPEKPIDGKLDIVRQTVGDFFWEQGWLREELSKNDQSEYLKKLLVRKFHSHSNSVSLRTYRPTISYCFAVIVWDFLPVRTISNTKMAIRLLHDAIDQVKILEKDDLGVYSFTKIYGEVMPPGKFIRHLKRTIQMIEDKAGDYPAKRDDSEIIEPDADLSSLIFTMHV